MTIPGNFVAGDILTASDMNALPGGYITASSFGTNQFGYTSTLTDVGSSVTFTAGTGRKYLVFGRVFGTQNSFDGVVTLNVTTSANAFIETLANRKIKAGDSESFSGWALYEPSSGSTTIKMRLSVAAGTFDAINSTLSARLMVFDLGT